MILSSLGKHLVLFGFLLALWVANIFPVQRAEHVLQASAIVSPQRLIALQSLAREKLGDESSVRWIRYARSAKAGTRSRVEPSVEHLQLEIGVRANAGLREIEQELERLTMPSDGTETLSDEGRRVRAERWRLTSIDHQMERFRLDRQREENSLAVSTVNRDEATDAIERSNRGVTISFRKPLHDSGMVDTPKASEANPSDSDRPRSPEKSWSSKDQQTWNGLLTNRSQCLRCIESLESQILATQMHAAGTIALTGAPKYGVLSGRASFGNFISIVVMSGFCALVLGTILRSPVVQRKVTIQRHRTAQRQESRQPTREPSRTEVVSKSTSISSMVWKPTDTDPITSRMTQLNVSCLGTIEMRLHSKVQSGTFDNSVSMTEAEEGVGHDAVYPASLRLAMDGSRTPMLKFGAIAIEKINSWVLWSWVALFAFRFATDPNWRELLFSAPLAAFSSMVLGVY